MGIVGKVIKTTGKVIGTAVVGGFGAITGAAGGVLESNGMKDTAKGFNKVSDTCFTVVKDLWSNDPNKLRADFDTLRMEAQTAADSLETVRSMINSEQKETIRMALLNTNAMEALLKEKGKDPKLAHNEKFMKTMRDRFQEKYGEPV